MGVIERQSIKHTAVNYVGVAIGILSTLFVYPDAQELYGLYLSVFSSALIITSFFLLGFNVLAIKFFPHFKNEENGHNGFLMLLIKGGLIGFILSMLALPLIKYLLLDLLFNNNPEGKALFQEHFYFIIPLVFLFIFNNLFIKYISNFHRIVIPTILDQLLIKIVLPISVILYLMKIIDIRTFFICILVNYLVVFIGLIFYTKNLKQLFLSSTKGFVTKPLANEMKSNAVFGILNALGTQLAFRIDTLMVAGLVSMSSGGIYGIVNVLIDVITKPAKAIRAIASPIISESWRNNNLSEIENIYKKSSIVLLISGLYVFMGVCLSVDDLFSIMPQSESMRQGKYVLILLGIAKLIDLGTSVNTQIILNSKKFKFNFYALLCLAVLNIAFNLVFILHYDMGMTGAALATLCSLGLFNFMKLVFIKLNFGMQPFSNKTLVLLIVSGICFTICYYIPLDFHPIVNILIRSSVLSILFLSSVVYLNISEDFNKTLSRFVPFLEP